MLSCHHYKQLLSSPESPFWKTQRDSGLLSELLTFILNIRESIRRLDVGPDSFSCWAKQTVIAGMKYRGARIKPYLIQVLVQRRELPLSFLKHKLLLVGNQFRPWNIIHFHFHFGKKKLNRNCKMPMTTSVCSQQLCCSFQQCSRVKNKKSEIKMIYHLKHGKRWLLNKRQKSQSV